MTVTHPHFVSVVFTVTGLWTVSVSEDLFCTSRTFIQAHFLWTSGGRFLFASFLHRNSLRVENVKNKYAGTWKCNQTNMRGLGSDPLPPTKFKAMIPSNSHCRQGGAHTRTQTTAEPLGCTQMALPAPIPSGRAKEPSATSAT